MIAASTSVVTLRMHRHRKPSAILAGRLGGADARMRRCRPILINLF